MHLPMTSFSSASIHEIAKKTINKTYADDTITSVILGDMHRAKKNLQDAYECKATIGGKPIFMTQKFIVKRLDEVTEAINSIHEKVDSIKAIRDCCGSIETLPDKEEGISFDLKIGSETKTVRVEIYREKSIVDGMTYHNPRITFTLKDYPSLKGDIRLLRADAISALEKEGASFIDLTRNGVAEKKLFQLPSILNLKSILDREQTVFKWQPDDTDNEDVK